MFHSALKLHVGPMVATEIPHVDHSVCFLQQVSDAVGDY